MRDEINVVTPSSLDEALDILRNRRSLKIIAGGSDIIVQLRDGVIEPSTLLNILSLKELRYIREGDDRIRIGALATYNDIIASSLTRKHAWVLVDAARQIGAAQLQNTATLGGNLGNASPAGDSLPPLYALDAVIVTRNASGRRETPIEEFFIDYRKTTLLDDEMIEEVHFKPLTTNDRGAYIKLGLREANAISIVDVAVVLRGKQVGESFSDVRVSLGAVAPTVKRSRKSEAELVGRPLTLNAIQRAAELAVSDSVPISDIRGSADYRKHVVASLVYAALYQAIYGKRS